MERIEVNRFTCDGCGKETMMETSEGLPDGYHGKVYEVGSWGGSGDVEWYACKDACLRKAIVSALERDREEQRTHG